MWVQVLPFHLCLQFMLFVWEEVNFDKRVTCATEILGWQLLSFQYFDSQSGFLKIVANTELDTTQIFPAGAVMTLIILRARGKL